MPQIWMTYNELAELLGRGLDDARGCIERNGLDRRKSRDGTIRVKLNLELTELFVAKLIGEAQSLALDDAVETMRGMRAAMARYENKVPQPRTAPEEGGASVTAAAESRRA
ncbi:MAG TPA: hypothetical protein VE224_10935 [Pseudolabrys sp.]|nr:hypothetical protein [Pseudolabrys sp.]